MSWTEETLSRIASYGHQYRSRHLSKYEPNMLLSDWWEALEFFFGRAFYQGRSDIVSALVHRAAVETLAPIFSGEAKTEAYQARRRENWRGIEQELSRRIGKGCVGKAGDIQMTVSVLDFIGHLPELNIVKYSVARIKSNQLPSHYIELQKSKSLRGDGIFQVGDKIASFYLRDVVSLFDLDEHIPDEFMVVLQPVDVHVERVALLTGIAKAGADKNEIRSNIVAACKRSSVSPLLFNQGAWFVSYFHPEELRRITRTAGAAKRAILIKRRDREDA